MEKPKVLYICHNHPIVRPGGAEAYALELYEGMRQHGEFEPIFVAKGGPPLSKRKQPHPGSPFGLVDGDPNQYFVYTEGYEFDYLYGSMVGKEFYTKHFHEFLLAYKPAVVHFQHTLFLGYDLIREVRNTLPNVPILYTLHEYLPICHRQGQMIRTIGGNELCDRESPQRCNECFPDVSPQTFFMRKQFVQSHFSLVDQFIAPCHFLRQKYIDWGIPAEKIVFEEYGRHPVKPLPEKIEDRPRNRFGFFGQLNPYKGATVLFDAVKHFKQELAAKTASSRGRRSSAACEVPVDIAPDIRIHGANLDLQPGTFQNEFRAMLEATKDRVAMVGQYKHEDLPRLMSEIDWVIVPSTWWENSPLVIQEAFGYGRPVICSNIGGMAEKVADRVNGLHFRVKDPAHLSQVLHEAANSPGLWEALRRGIRPPYSMSEHVNSVANMYRSLRRRKAEAA